MPTNVTIMSWNVQKYGTSKAGKSTALPQIIATVVELQQVDILVILELMNNANDAIMKSIVDLLDESNFNTGNWNWQWVCVGDESVGFIWHTNTFNAVPGQPNGNACGAIYVSYLNKPLYFPETQTSWANIGGKPDGRRPAFMLFQTNDNNTPFVVAGIHTPFSDVNIQAYSAYQYGCSREFGLVPLPTVLQTITSLEDSENRELLSDLIMPSCENLPVAVNEEQIEYVIETMVLNCFTVTAIAEKVITFDATLFNDLCTSAIGKMDGALWTGSVAENVISITGCIMAAAAGVLAQVWGMAVAATVANVLSSFPNPVTFYPVANANLGTNVLTFFGKVPQPNTFADVGKNYASRVVSYAVFAGDFNVNSPDPNNYTAAQQLALGWNGGNGTAFTLLSTNVGAGSRAMAFDNNTLTTSVAGFQEAFQYTWNQQNFDNLSTDANQKNNTQLIALLAALQTLKPTNFYCSYSLFNTTVAQAIAAKNLPANYITTYSAEIGQVFPITNVVSQTQQLRANSYDNFSCQAPANVQTPYGVGQAPDIVSELGSWQAATATCQWPAATNQLNAIAQAFLQSLNPPFKSLSYTVPPALIDSIDAGMFYLQYVSDHFPITIQLTLP